MDGPPKNRRGEPLPWFTLHEPATEALRKVVMDQKWLGSMCYYVTFRLVWQCSVVESLLYCIHSVLLCIMYYRHTGYLESFHNLVLMYNPKRVVFRYVFLCFNREVDCESIINIYVIMQTSSVTNKISILHLQACSICGSDISRYSRSQPPCVTAGKGHSSR